MSMFKLYRFIRVSFDRSVFQESSFFDMKGHAYVEEKKWLGGVGESCGGEEKNTTHGDEVRAKHRRHGLDTDDAEPHARRHAVGEVACREPTPAAGSVDFIPPEDGVDHLHAAENAQKKRVATRPTITAA